MCCKNFWKRIIPFTLALGVGLLAVDVLHKENLLENKQEISVAKVAHSENGTGSSGESHKGLPQSYILGYSQTCYLESDTIRITSKPYPNYTNAARQKQIEGRVLLLVTFLASGQIGKISPVTNMPDGLTEEAIVAAKQIKFKPEIRNKKPITVTKQVAYDFKLY